MTRVRPPTFALTDLARMAITGRKEFWLLRTEDDHPFWGWWSRIDGTEDIVAYAEVHP